MSRKVEEFLYVLSVLLTRVRCGKVWTTGTKPCLTVLGCKESQVWFLIFARLLMIVAWEGEEGGSLFVAGLLFCRFFHFVWLFGTTW